MKFEVLKQGCLKKNIIIGVVAILIISAVVLNFTRAKYRTTQSIPLVNGTINYSLADLNIVAITVDGESVDAIPEGNYELTENSYCTVNGEEDSSISISYDISTQTLQVIPFTTKGTKCYLDFTERVSAGETILGNVTVNNGTPDFSQAATTDEGVWTAEDNLGTSYYFRGAVTNNYVCFAGFYWRIIRINGDGSIRIIYDGTIAHVNNDDDEDRQIGTSAYNSSRDASYYVGYTYQTNAQRPSSQNSGTASTIKGVLDSWYSTNIGNQGLDDKVVSSPGFCNDRNTASGSNWATSGTFYYAADDRVNGTIAPTLKCSNSNDLYTTKVGLITADEVRMAGANATDRNYNIYLYAGEYYWTMTPDSVVGDNVYVFYVSSGSFRASGMVISSNSIGVRPVINLSADVTLTGSGTISDPYVVS